MKDRRAWISTLFGSDTKVSDENKKFGEQYDQEQSAFSIVSPEHLVDDTGIDYAEFKQERQILQEAFDKTNVTIQRTTQQAA